MTPARLFLRCVRWGLTTGAAAGAATSAVLGFVAGDDLGDGTIGARLALAAGFILYGLPIGMILAIVPTLIGGLLVIGVLWAGQPQPASADAVRRELGLAMHGLTAVLAGGVLAATFLFGKGMSSVVDSLPYVLVATACTVLVLRRARTSIARGWAGA